MIIKNKIGYPVFDALAKPIGKKRLINRRQLSIAAKPILAEYHLPIFTPHRGKRCYVSRYENLYKLNIKPIFTEKSFIPEYKYNKLEPSYSTNNIFSNNIETSIKIFKNDNKIELHQKDVLQIKNFDKKFLNYSFYLIENTFNPILISKKPIIPQSYFINNYNKYRFIFNSILYETYKTTKVLTNKKTIQNIKDKNFNGEFEKEKYTKIFSFSNCILKKSQIYFDTTLKKKLSFTQNKYNIEDINYILDADYIYSYELIKNKKEYSLLTIELPQKHNFPLIFIPIPKEFFFIKPINKNLPLLYINNKLSTYKENLSDFSSNKELCSRQTTFKVSNNTTYKIKPLLPNYNPKILIGSTFLVLPSINKTSIAKEKTKLNLSNVPTKYIRDFQFKTKTTKDILDFCKTDTDFKISYAKRDLSKNNLIKNSNITSKHSSKIDFKILLSNNNKQLQSVSTKFSKKQILQNILYKPKKQIMRFICVSQAKYTFKKIKMLKIRNSFRKGISKNKGYYSFLEQVTPKYHKDSYTHIFNTFTKNKQLFLSFNSKLFTLTKRANINQILKPERTKQIKKIFTNYLSLPIRQRGEQLKYPKFKAGKENFSKLILSSIKKVNFKNKLFNSKNLKISINTINYTNLFILNEKSKIKNVLNHYKNPSFIKSNDYKFRYYKYSVLTQKIRFNSNCILPTHANENSKSIIAPEKFEISSKKNSFKLRLLPYPFGFPNFVFLQEKYTSLALPCKFKPICSTNCQKQFSKNFTIIQEKKYRNPLSLREPKKFMFPKVSQSIFGKAIYIYYKNSENKKIALKTISSIKYSWQSKFYFISSLNSNVTYGMRQRIRGKKFIFNSYCNIIPAVKYVFTQKPIKACDNLLFNFSKFTLKYNKKFIYKTNKGLYSSNTEINYRDKLSLKIYPIQIHSDFESKLYSFILKHFKDIFLNIINPVNLDKAKTSDFKAMYRNFVSPYKVSEIKSKSISNNINYLEKNINKKTLKSSHIRAFGFVIDKFKTTELTYLENDSLKTNYYTVMSFAIRVYSTKIDYHNANDTGRINSFSQSIIKILPLKYTSFNLRIKFEKNKINLNLSKVMFNPTILFRPKLSYMLLSDNLKLSIYDKKQRIYYLPNLIINKFDKLLKFKMKNKNYIEKQTVYFNPIIKNYISYIDKINSTIKNSLNLTKIKLDRQLNPDPHCEFGSLEYKANLNKKQNLSITYFKEKNLSEKHIFREPGIPDWIDIDLSRPIVRGIIFSEHDV